MPSNDLTTAEAAALLTERGMTAEDGGAVKASTVQQWCKRELLDGAKRVGGNRRGTWLIPRATLERFATEHRPTGTHRTKKKE